MLRSVLKSSKDTLFPVGKSATLGLVERQTNSADVEASELLATILDEELHQILHGSLFVEVLGEVGDLLVAAVENNKR